MLATSRVDGEIDVVIGPGGSEVRKEVNICKREEDIAKKEVRGAIL